MARPRCQRHGLLCVLMAAVRFFLAPTSVLAQEEPELYLLDFHADGYLLAESVPAYERDGVLLIEFALFLESVEFPIEQHDKLWSGWFRDEEHPFTWRMDLGLVQLADGHSERIERDEWMSSYDGTYVSVDALERWFNLALDADLGAQVLTVISGEPLPFQLWRERLLAKYRYRSGKRGEADVVVPDQYHWATIPLADLSTNLLTQRTEGTSISSGTASLAMGMDLLKHSVVYTGGFSTSNAGEGGSSNRLSIERRSSTPETPMFAGVHGYSVGDIYQSSSNLISNSNTGRGFRIDRYPAGQRGYLNRATIAGDAPPGWEVELYRNGSLLQFATVGADGRYFFPDQEIPFGENIFVAKLYGPQGQTREDRYVYWGGGSNLAKGDYDFSISHIDFDRYLLDGRRNGADALPASYATSFSYSRALTDDFQLGAGYTRAGLGTLERDGTYTDADYLNLFGSIKLGPGVLVGETAHQVDSGMAWNLQYLTGFKGQKINLSRSAYHSYVSPATLYGDDLDSLNEISVFGSFGEDKRHAYTFGLRQRNLAEGPSDLRLFNQISMRLGRLSLTNDLEHRLGFGPDTTSGQVRIASRINGVSLRGQLDYLLTDPRPLRQISASTNWEIGRRLNNSLTMSKRLVDDHSLIISNLLSVRVRDYDLTFSMSSDLEGDWSVGAGFNVAFGYDRHTQTFITDIGGLANTGRATINVFVDENNDGVRDPQESPVAWASYRDQESLKAVPGAIPLTALPGSRAVQLDMQYLKLDDPFLLPRAETYELHTHSGSDVSIDVAVVMTGDIEGHVLAGSTGRESAVRGVIVVLCDAAGREVARTRSEFDGFYSFTGVPGGEYEVRVYANGGRNELKQKFSLDPQDGYIELERIYIFE